MLLTDHHREPAEDALLHRPRLIDLIERPGIARITLITAPAGYGKSTLAAQWAGQASHDVVWVSLRPEHNAPGRFVCDLANALAPVVGNDHQLLSGTPGEQPDILDLLATRTEAQPPLMIVLDDIHHIESGEIHRGITRLLTARITDIRWMVLSRTMSRLPLARMRAEGQVREIDMDDLAFDSSEVAGVARLLLARPLPEHQPDRLATHTGGWIVGIRLALLATQRAPAGRRDDELIGAVANEWIDTYITEEVLASLREARTSSCGPAGSPT